MSDTPHIFIIGAGLIGLSTADHLVSRGAQVTIIDARPGPGLGTSYSNSGMIHSSQARPWRFSNALFDGDDKAFRSVYDLACHSKTLLKTRMGTLGLRATKRAQGCYKIYNDMPTARRMQKRYIADGIQSQAMADSMRTLGLPALYFKEDMSGNAHDYCRALAEDLHARGVVFIYSAALTKLAAKNGKLTVSLKGHVFLADHVVVAAGPQSPDVLKQVGLSLPIKGVRGYAVNFERPDMVLPEAPLMDAHSHSAMTVFEDHLRFSGTVNEESARPLLKRWTQLVPDVMKRLLPATEVWSGLRPMSEKGRPFIGRTSIPRLWVNTGHGHMGWTLSAGSGELMSNMILDGISDERFALTD